MPSALQLAVQRIPPGAWAVGVSGGADSVALLHLAASRADLRLVVAHLNHQARGADSEADAAFVQALCRRLDLPCMLATRSQIEPRLPRRPANRSALYRACRRQFFMEVVQQNDLAGVLLAHHADDQAETVFHRLLRGSGALNLGGMAADTHLGGLRIVRPLLDVRRKVLRDYLVQLDQPWREDTSNASDAYARNRHRRLLDHHPALTECLLSLAGVLAELRQWVEAHAPELPEVVPLAMLHDWPDVLAGAALKRWLIRAGAPPGAVERAVVQRLLMMANDAAAPARQHFPGGIAVRRRRGMLSTE